MVERLRAVPAWAWLGAIVLGSFAIRGWLVRAMSAPFVMVDELIYSELAKSVADSGAFAVRGVETSGYSVLYPLLIAPAYAVFDRVPDAYAIVKVINSLTMSLAAVPAYLIARRIVGEPLSLLAAVLAVAIPSLAYTGTVTTESLFYPIALTVALLLLVYLERPSLRWLAALGVGVVAAFLTRSQALVFVPVAATAPLVLAALRRDVRTIRPFGPLYALLAAGAIGAFALQSARDASLRDLLGAYSIVGEGGYDAGLVARFWLWHVEELTLYVGVVPVAAFLVLLAVSRGLPARLQEHLAVTAASMIWGTLVVAAFASRFASDRIQDRYLFYLAPLLLVALLGWIDAGTPRPRSIVLPAAAVALALPLFFPYERFIGEPAKSDTLGLIPLWSINEHLPFGSYWATVALVGGALTGLALLVRRPVAVVVPLALLVLFVVESRPVWSGAQGFVQASRGALFQGIRTVPRDWIDERVPEQAEVAVLWTGIPDRFTVNQNEFFNRNVGQVFYLGQPTPGGIGEVKVRVDRDGVFRREDGSPVVASYALLDGTITPAGRPLARDVQAWGMTVWKLDSPLRTTTRVKGLYPRDTWSGRSVTWTQEPCRGGTLAVSLSSDPTLFEETRQTVSATTAGQNRVALVLEPDEFATLRVPLQPAEGRCVVRFTVSPTAVPARVIPGATDRRELGVHFNAFTLEP